MIWMVMKQRTKIIIAMNMMMMIMLQLVVVVVAGRAVLADEFVFYGK